MLDAGPFDEVYIAARKRQSYLQNLFTKVIDKDIAVAAITHIGGNWSPSFFAVAKREPALLTIPNKEAIPDIARSLSRIKPWHYSSFCIIFTESLFVEKLMQQTSIWNKSIPEIEQALSSTILGYCDAVDGGLWFYGNKTIQDIVSSIPRA